ncbi:sensor histidine kinase [Calidifontibacillus erzurumensis]|uniref:histidine kinase n=1 Tax=Calidifontibacillus erzurumensis TaxID=2741433 RepID=A0A8J8GFE8_9BACI|nr:HAMP domain-containing sensor histidine kinase [Calidifontibacillus erzurumensis]NSL52332.1 HAMP domain-containing histidine kinase [Calidifontibacillus erzurumensis]
MSIKKRLLLSNIGMIVIPIAGFIIIEVILSHLMFSVYKGNLQDVDFQLFFKLRFIVIVLILVITNGFLTYFVSRSIIKPIKKLTIAARKISEGDLEFSVASEKKDELGELSNTFEMMRLRLKQAKADQEKYERNRKELIASISHDLFTPLTSIKGYVKGVQDGVANTPEKLERYMNTIYKTANDMEKLIENLFQYSKLDLESIPFEFDQVDLYSFFADFIEEIGFDLEKEGGTASLHANKNENFIVEADREQLRRVVTNIIQNSLKYMNKERKKIDVYLTSDDEKVTVEIKDNGSGIAQEDLPYIFESFYRTDASRNSSTGGSGLGLAIVKKIIEEHRGKVWADSEQGVGTSICFTLKKVSSSQNDQ